jgi:hypothetical protein
MLFGASKTILWCTLFHCCFLRIVLTKKPVFNSASSRLCPLEYEMRLDLLFSLAPLPLPPPQEKEKSNWVKKYQAFILLLKLNWIEIPFTTCQLSPRLYFHFISLSLSSHCCAGIGCGAYIIWQGRSGGHGARFQRQLIAWSFMFLFLYPLLVFLTCAIVHGRIF